MAQVLIADDSQSNRELLNFLFCDLGFKCELVSNGEAAVEKALESCFELVLLDINMPVMSGEEALRTLRALNYSGAIAACSAESEPDEIKRIMAEGFDGWLQKPVDPKGISELLKSLNLLTERSPLEQDLVVDGKIQHLAAQFKKNLPNVLAQLEKARNEHSISQIKAIAHRLKGIAPTFNYPVLGKLAGGIEKAVKQGQIDEATARTDLLINKLKKDIQLSAKSSPDDF